MGILSQTWKELKIVDYAEQVNFLEMCLHIKSKTKNVIGKIRTPDKN